MILLWPHAGRRFSLCHLGKMKGFRIFVEGASFNVVQELN